MKSHRRRSFQSLAANRSAHVQALDQRVLLSADIPLGSYALSYNDRSPAVLSMRQGMQVAEVREAFANAGTRIANLNQLSMEVGPYDQYVGDEYPYYYSGYPFYYPLDTVSYGKTYISGAGVSESPLTIGGFTGPWAQAYDEEANLIELGDISGALPAIYSQGFSDDFHDFVPDSLTNSTVSSLHTYSGTTSAGLQLTVSAQHTITRTIDASGIWQFTESVVAAYTFVETTSNWQEPSELGGMPLSGDGYGYYDWGNYGTGFGLTRISSLAGAGTLNYQFTSSGTSSGGNAKISSYTLTSSGNDQFSEAMNGTGTQTYSGGYGNSPSQTVSVQVTGVMTGLRTYSDTISATFAWTGSNWSSAYSESGQQSRASQVHAIGQLSRTLGGNLIESGGVDENLAETSAGSYSGSGTYAGGAQTPTTRVGSRTTNGSQSTAYDFQHNGVFSLQESQSWVGSSGVTNTTTNLVAQDWSDSFQNALSVSYIDVENYFADGTRQLQTTQSNQQASELSVNFDIRRESHTTGDETRNYLELRGDSNVLARPEIFVRIGSSIQKNLTTHFAADDSIEGREGTDVTVGDVLFQHANSVDGDHTYDRTLTNVGSLNTGTQNQDDFWDEQFLDQYYNKFDHETVYHPDDTFSEIVDDVGFGNGFWNLRKHGTYDWDGSGDTWTTAIDDDYDLKYGDDWDYLLDADFVAVHNDDGTPISKLGYHNILDNSTGGVPNLALIGLTAPPPLAVIQSGAYGRGRDEKVDYLSTLVHGYSYSSNDPMYGTSSGSVSLNTLYENHIWNSDSFVHNDNYTTVWDSSGETRTESLMGSGSGFKDHASDWGYHFGSSWSGMGMSGSENYDDESHFDDDQNYTYSYLGVITHVKPVGASSFSRSGQIQDAGASDGLRISEGEYTYSSTYYGSTYSEGADYFDQMTFDLNYNLLTQIAGGTETQTGTADVLTGYNWHTSWWNPYGSGSSSGSGSGTHSLMPFDVLRAGRNRIIAWQSPLFEVGNELRIPIGWFAEAGVPVTRMIDVDPHRVVGQSGGYGYGYGYGYGGYGYWGYWYGNASGYNFN